MNVIEIKIDRTFLIFGNEGLSYILQLNEYRWEIRDWNNQPIRESDLSLLGILGEMGIEESDIDHIPRNHMPLLAIPTKKAIEVIKNELYHVYSEYGELIFKIRRQKGEPYHWQLIHILRGLVMERKSRSNIFDYLRLQPSNVYDVS
jgi:hypothetical protein